MFSDSGNSALIFGGITDVAVFATNPGLLCTLLHIHIQVAVVHSGQCCKPFWSHCLSCFKKYIIVMEQENLT